MSTLDFPFAPLVELAKHAKAASKHSASYGEKARGPALILVGDRGVYFMSNGIPNLRKKDGSEGSHVVYANGCNPDKNQDWYDLKRATFGGDDGTEMLDIVETILDAEKDGDATTVRVTFLPDTLKIAVIAAKERVVR